MAEKQKVHTVPTEDGWANRREGAQRASSPQDSAAEAQAAAPRGREEGRRRAPDPQEGRHHRRPKLLRQRLPPAQGSRATCSSGHGRFRHRSRSSPQCMIYHGPLTIGPEQGASTQHQELPIMPVTCANTSRHHHPIRLSAPWTTRNITTRKPVEPQWNQGQTVLAADAHVCFDSWQVAVARGAGRSIGDGVAVDGIDWTDVDDLSRGVDVEVDVALARVAGG